MSLAVVVEGDPLALAVHSAVNDHAFIVDPPAERAAVATLPSAAPRLDRVATVLLVRHGRSAANSGGVLAGRTPGVQLDDVGQRAGGGHRQPDRAAADRGGRLQPARALPADRRGNRRRAERRPRVADRRPADRVRVRRLDRAASSRSSPRTRCGRSCRRTRAASRSREGSRCATMQARAVAAVRDWDAEITAEHGPDAIWAAVEPWRRDQGDPRRRARVAPRQLPADRGRPGLGLGGLATRRCARSWSRCNEHGRPRRPRRRPSARRRRKTASSDAVVGGGAGSWRGFIAYAVGLSACRSSSTTSNSPDRFVAGTVGEPGQRTFFLQARDGNRVTSVALEKQQVSILAERVDLLLDEALRRSGGDSAIPAVAPVGPSDRSRSTSRSSRSSASARSRCRWDREDRRVVIELFPVTDETVVMPDDDDRRHDDSDDSDDSEASDPSDAVEIEVEVEASEVLIVKLDAGVRPRLRPAGAVRRLGRPPALPVLRQPARPRGHICAPAPTGSGALPD